MGLLDPNTETATPAQIIADGVINSFRSQQLMVTQTYLRNYEAIYRTPGVNPQDVLDALSTSARAKTSAAEVFATINTIMSVINPEALLPVPDAYSPYTVDQQTGRVLLAVPSNTETA